MARKRKTLPKDFAEMLTSASVDELKAVFGKCEIDARGGYAKGTAIGFPECPDELIVWLTGQGLAVDTPDSYGRTPLHARASRAAPKPIAQIPLLLSLGADIEAADSSGQTPLQAAVDGLKAGAARVLIEHGASTEVLDRRGNTLLTRGLIGTRNADIPKCVEIAKLLLEHGASITAGMRQKVERIGSGFEFHRENFNPDLLEETDAALSELYRIFGVEPVARRSTHDGVSPIVVPDGPWRERHKALWELLVPSTGAGATVQCEAIRVTGRIFDEMFRNGGANWDRDYRAMADAFPGFLARGEPLGEEELQEAKEIAKQVRSGRGADGHLDRLRELAVVWVAKNPGPIALGPVDYTR
ncbi:ankyrin repeat domain-containing protein [Amycolatopsis sp. WAC 01416]|uniref:ankyrin repeat domain-containing protein n=1 Tax=Amycolatopsis sp. WAC 01416 TaxID=2203196 RepID=UPI000F7B77CD|nr:ankyrin repeat domain-containing protein [Amycolatopsis sp. WAC 01416]RSN31958.1 ankyrin repeat domain-containing protein [Amycolatopsis sp. WAC 01416]